MWCERVLGFVFRCYLRAYQTHRATPEGNSSYTLSRLDTRLVASQKVVDLIPYLYQRECAYTFCAIPSWLLEYSVPGDFWPTIDVLIPEQQFILSFSDEEERTLLEDIFVRRLNLGYDAIPVLPVFCTPEEILAAPNLTELALVLNHAWQKTLVWALQNLPRYPSDIDHRPSEYSRSGTWVDRRRWIEEAQHAALFRLDLTGPTL